MQFGVLDPIGHGWLMFQKTPHLIEKVGFLWLQFVFFHLFGQGEGVLFLRSFKVNFAMSWEDGPPS